MGLVTPVTAIKVIAIIEIAPIGKALPMMANIVPIKRANNCQALTLTPSGTGIINQIMRVIVIAIKVGNGLGGVNLSILYYPIREIYLHKK